jgi:hypothetical protein
MQDSLIFVVNDRPFLATSLPKATVRIVDKAAYEAIFERTAA